MKLYSFSEEELERITGIVPYYVSTTIPAGTYQGQNEDVETFGVNTVLVTNVNQPEELIYEITKALWNDNSRQLFDTSHPKGRVITLENALLGIEELNVPLHPGAQRAYDELLAR